MSDTYNVAKERLATGDLSWSDGVKNFVIVAVTSSYVFDPDHQFLSNVVANELTGTGTRAPVSNRTVVKNLTLDQAELHADDSVLPSIDTTEPIGYLVVAEEGASDADSNLVAYLTSNVGGDPFNLATNGANINISYQSGRVAIIT